MAVAYVYVEHTYCGDLVIDLGVGDPIEPEWSTKIWNREEMVEHNLNLTIDLSEVTRYLPPSESFRWFLKVFDAANENLGQIVEFKITYQGHVYASTCVPVAIYDLQTSYSYILGVPVELAISRRKSIRSLQETTPVLWETLSSVLWAGYGFSSWGRTVPNICGSYPLVVYVRNGSSVYTYDPAASSLNLWTGGYYKYWESPIELFIVLDMNRSADIYLGAEEAGCMVQNIYLEANALGLGTVSVGAVLEDSGIHDGLGLPPHEHILYDMPLGYPEPLSLYNFTCVNPPGSSELPQVKQSSIFLDYALMERKSSHDWSETPLTSQEISQVLWSAYGFSYLKDLSQDIQHRSVPSAYARYPLTIYLANASGIYEYLPYNHSISLTIDGDKRAEISDASGEDWVASALSSLIIVWDSTKLENKTWAYTEVGCVVQNVYLEGVAWGLVADMVNDVNEDAMRTVLGLDEQTNFHPVSVVTVGHPDITPPIISILSPENKTYTVNTVPLTFTVTEATSWIGYSLDGQMNVTTTGNTTIVSLPDGTHTITVYANDTAGNMGASSTVYFVVDTTPPNIMEVSQNPLKNNVRPEDEVKINVTVTDNLSGVRQVTLNYTNGNGTWIIVEMTNLEENIWNATTPAFPYCTNVTYIVIAVDNINNIITTKEMGYEYQYHVIPEFPHFLILLLSMTVTLLAVMIYIRKHCARRQSPQFAQESRLHRNQILRDKLPSIRMETKFTAKKR
jgi:SagB-type dehydrogenase family enzyme